MIRIELHLQLDYQIDDPQGADFIFNIHAAKTASQTVQREKLLLSQPVAHEIVTDPATATRFMRLHAEPGPLRLVYDATLDIDHHKAEPDRLSEVPVRTLPLEVMQYIYPSRYCQSDQLMRLAHGTFGGLRQGYSRVLAIQKWVQSHVTFTSNTSDSSTSAVDTLAQQTGVCRDFAHLMIALCRAVNIPARIATGTDYASDPALGPPDFHAYVEAFLGDRWYIFDASGTSVPMGFIRLGTGRDAADVAFATIFGGVTTQPPIIRTRAFQGGAGGFVLPRRSKQALSTAGASFIS